MTDYIICIPSYNRAHGVLNKTLKVLNKYNISNEKIYIFVNTDEQKREYESIIPNNMYGKIIATKQEKGIKNVRNFIVDYLPMNQKFVSMDDDVVAIQEMDECGKLRDISDLNELIINGFAICEALEFNLWGLYPVSNPFYMKSKKEYSTGLKFIVGGFMAIINKKRYVNIDWKEDYELSIEAFVQDGGLLRYNHICVKHHLYTKTGGIGKSQLERMDDYKIASEYLLHKYPEYVRMNTRREGEILLKRSKTQLDFKFKRPV